MFSSEIIIRKGESKYMNFLKFISIDNENRVYKKVSNVKNLIREKFFILDEYLAQNLTRK